MSRLFQKYVAEAWPYRYRTTLRVRRLTGGTPSDPKVAESWIRSKVTGHDDLIAEAVAEIMSERGINAEEAAAVAAKNRHLVGFKHDPARDGEMYIEGRQIKAAIKESASVCLAAGKLTKGRAWGETKKGLQGFVAEHVQVEEDRIYLGANVPDGVDQKFVHTHNGSGIQYEEYMRSVDITFTICTDTTALNERFWAMVWLTGELQGIGGARSQGSGRYEVVEFEPIPAGTGKSVK